MVVQDGVFDPNLNPRPALVVSNIDDRAFDLAVVMVGNSRERIAT
jgi:hypothetical protein